MIDNTQMGAEMQPVQPDDMQMQPMTGEGQHAGPEEQQAYNTFVAQAWNVVYDERMFPQVLEMLKGEGDPMEGLARTAAMVIAKVAQSAEEAGKPIPSDVGLHAGTEVFEDLAELSKEAGIKDYSEDPDALEGAYFRTLDHVRVMMQEAGKIDPAHAQEEMGRLMQMDESGELEQMLTQYAQTNPRGAQKPREEEKPAPRGLMSGGM